MPLVPPRPRASAALTEARTCRSRLLTAAEAVERLPAERRATVAEGRRLEARDGLGTHADLVNLTGFHAGIAERADEAEIANALRAAAALLEKWK